MRLSKSTVLYTAIAACAIAALGWVAIKDPAQVIPAGLENRAELEGLRDGDMKKLQFHAEPKAVPAIAFETADGGKATLADYAGKRLVLNIFPSIDTDVCAASVRRFNEEAAGRDNITVLGVSMMGTFDPAIGPLVPVLADVPPVGALTTSSPRRSRARRRFSRTSTICSRVLRAEEMSWQLAARTPGTLLAAMAEPMPAPSTTMPHRLEPSATSWATARAKSG